MSVPSGGVAVVAVLVVLLVVLPAAALSAPLRVAALDRAAARRGGDAPLPDASVEEVALVAGGPRRVVEAAVARLVEGGLITVAPDRTLYATGRAPQGDLDRAVLAAVTSPLPPVASAVVDRVEHGREVDAVVDAAVRRGLLHDRTALARIRRDALVALGAVVLAGLVVPALLLGARAAGLGVLAVLGGLVGIIGVVLSARVRRATPRGRATLVAATPSPAWGPVAAPNAGPAGSRTASRGPALAVDAAGLVAVGGFARFPHAGVASLLIPPPASNGWSAGGVFVGGGDGGGGCGGDGGGGGGSC